MSWNQCVQGGGSRLLYEAMICRQCEAVAASAFTAPVTDIRSAQRRCAPIAMARATAIHLAAAGFDCRMLPRVAFSDVTAPQSATPASGLRIAGRPIPSSI